MSYESRPFGASSPALARRLAPVLPVMVVAGLVSCTSPAVKTPTSGTHSGDWSAPTSAGFHGAIVKAAGYDYTKADWKGMTCNVCHAGTSATEASPISKAPNCFACHAGGPDGSPAHPAGWSGGSVHGALVKAAGYDYTKATAGGLACSACHAGDNPTQLSVNSRAANCYTCHAGGPDGTAGHPPGWLDVAAPTFHGAVVVAAGYNYTKALAGNLPCSACHAGDSPTQLSPNSRAPNCGACHVGGPDGSAAHPISWLSDASDCITCHLGLPGGGPGPTPKPTPTASPGPATLSLAAALYTGVSQPVRVTVQDLRVARAAGAAATVAVQVRSVAEPTAETLLLVETASGSGTFTGTIALERKFDASGAAVAVAANGKIAVYAEGGVDMDTLTVTYGALSRTAGYTEPASTVTGIIQLASSPTGGVSVVLTGNGGFHRATVSRSDGSYAFHDVPSGTYYLTAAVNGAVQRTSTVIVP